MKQKILPAIGLVSFILLALVVAETDASNPKKLGRDQKIFLEESFWKEAEERFGDFGGGYWLKQKAFSVRFEGGNWYLTEDHHYEIVVLNARRMEKFANVTIPMPPRSRIVSLMARTIRSNGEILPVSKDKIYEKSLFPEFMLFADSKSKVFAMPGVTDRCVLDYSYRIEIQGIGSGDIYYFGEEIPVRKAVYSFCLDARIFNAGYRIHYVDRNVAVKPKSEVLTTPFGNLGVFTWTLEDIEAFPVDPMSPPRDQFVPTVYVGAFAPNENPADWSGMAKAYSLYLAPWLNQDIPEVARVVDEIAGDLSTPKEIIQCVMNYIGNNFRYVAIEVGKSGYQPHHPIEVLRNSYGDCKDMSTLVTSMLRHKGIAAYPALVLTRSSGTIDRALAIPAFDHMIVYVELEDGDLWLDPTAAPYPLGYVPGEDRGIDALVIKKEDVAWKRIPNDCPYPRSSVVTVSVEVDELGNLRGSGSVTLSGDFAFGLMRALSREDEKSRKRIIEETLLSFFNEVSIDSCAIAEFDHENLRAGLFAAFSKASAGVRVDDKLILRPDFIGGIAQRHWYTTRSKTRTLPLWIPDATTEIDTVIIVAPKGWVVEKVPQSISIESDFGSQVVTTRRAETSVEIILTTKQKALSVPATKVEPFGDFWSQARDMIRREFVFRKI